MKWALILLTVCASSCGDILCARSMSTGGELEYSGPSAIVRAVRYIITRRMVIMGVLCYATAFFSLLSLLSIAQLSLAVPATGVVLALNASPPTHPLAGTSRANGASLQPCEDKPSHHQPRTDDFHQQSAPCEILAKP
jgi:hypothetical protein